METEMIELEINGVAVSVPKGSNLLVAAKAANVKIPTLCYHPDLKAGAIAGTVKNPHVIDPSKCVKCGACEATCKFGAISHS